LLGPRPYDTLPSYLAAMDVALIPFKKDRVTYHADPIKAYEYLAAGVPVVATDLPALRRLQHVLHLADSPDAFATQLDAALAEAADPQRRAERQAEAARHTWASRFAHVDSLIQDTFPCAS
ncbi:MAG TPA: glycosyltransferase, partial [Chloroflexota bacterium]